MKRFFVFFIFAIVGINIADYATAQQRANVKISATTVNVPKGKMPPRWLLNKVTQAQYDTLAALNKLCTVDYSMLRGYDVKPNDVAKVMTQAREFIRKAMDNNNGMTRDVGWQTIRMVIVHPWSDKVEKGSRKVEYMVYSSADGYDAHLLLRATLQRDRKTGGYRSVDYEVVPYSIQSMPVKVEKAYISKDGRNKVDYIEIDKGAQSSSYIISATMNYVDPLGNKHVEKINAHVQLTL